MAPPRSTEPPEGAKPAQNAGAPDPAANKVAGSKTSATVAANANRLITAWKGMLRIIAFFALIILLACGVNALINLGLHRIKTNQFGVSNQIVKGQINADIIITGSSRAVSHYDPRIITSVTGLKAFNIGRNGSQTDMQVAVLKTYLKHNRKPRMVIHNLDAFSFVMTREVYDPGQYVPYLNETDLYDALHKINSDVWWKCRHMPLFGYMAEDTRLDWMLSIQGLAGKSPRETFYQGFNPREGAWTDDFAKFLIANPNGINFEIQPDGVQVMADLIHLCHENGIQLILVYSPEYLKMQPLTRNRAAIFEKYEELAKPFDVAIWDFSHWEHAEDTEYFVNSQHLNAKGAEIFSTDLAHRLATELGSEAGQNPVNTNAAAANFK